jgi:Matrixin
MGSVMHRGKRAMTTIALGHALFLQATGHLNLAHQSVSDTIFFLGKAYNDHVKLLGQPEQKKLDHLVDLIVTSFAQSDAPPFRRVTIIGHADKDFHGAAWENNVSFNRASDVEDELNKRLRDEWERRNMGPLPPGGIVETSKDARGSQELIAPPFDQKNRRVEITIFRDGPPLPPRAAQVSVRFHFLDGPPGIMTRRGRNVDAIIDKMNEIYRDNHVGLEFFAKDINPHLPVPNLVGIDRDGTILSGIRMSEFRDTDDFHRIRSVLDSTSLFNVCFVGNFVDDDKPLIPLTNLHAQTTRPPAGIPPLRCCVCRDNLPNDVGETLAHEAGHALGEDHSSDPDSLMFQGSKRRTGTKIDADMAARMRASFKDWQQNPPPPFTVQFP